MLPGVAPFTGDALAMARALQEAGRGGVVERGVVEMAARRRRGAMAPAKAAPTPPAPRPKAPRPPRPWEIAAAARRERVLALCDGDRTQGEIAAALGVSRDIVAADMKALRRSGHAPALRSPGARRR